MIGPARDVVPGLRWFAVSVAAVVLVLPAVTASATNLTGRWRFRFSATDVQYVDVTDVAGVVSAVVQPSGLPSPVAIDGTYSDVSGTLAMDDPACTPTFCFGVSARVMPDGDDLTGYVAYVSLPLPSYVPVTAHRCECDDGNTADGDGCDAECRIEPCFTCAGMPSICVPSNDGATCEDGSPCTTGETCTAGTCGGGSAMAAPCADLNGDWVFRYEVAGFGVIATDPVKIRHRGTTFRVTGPSSVAVGSITQSTGALSMPQPITSPLCPGFTIFAGSTNPGGDALLLGGTTYASTPHGCVAFGAGIDGRRAGCGDGLYEPGELCDDGNVASGDGCDDQCVPEPCFTCSGIAPTVCEPAYAAACSAPLQAERSSLVLRNVAKDAQDTLIHRLRSGSRLSIAALGNPAGSSDYEVCVFDLSLGSPRVRFAARIDGGGTCDGRPCWRAVPRGFQFKSKAGNASGIQLLDVRGGLDGQSGVRLRGRGSNLSSGALGLPALPLPTPLTLVVRRLDGPACFATNFTTPLENSAVTGRFRARGTP